VSKKPKLDSFHYHEMLDRLKVTGLNIDGNLQQHPVAKIDVEVSKHISSAVDSLYLAYQLIKEKQNEIKN